MPQDEFRKGGIAPEPQKRGAQNFGNFKILKIANVVAWCRRMCW